MSLYESLEKRIVALEKEMREHVHPVWEYRLGGLVDCGASKMPGVGGGYLTEEARATGECRVPATVPHGDNSLAHDRDIGFYGHPTSMNAPDPKAFMNHLDPGKWAKSAAALGAKPVDIGVSGYAPSPSVEELARDLLDRMGVPNARDYSCGNLVELANLIADTFKVRKERDELKAKVDEAANKALSVATKYDALAQENIELKAKVEELTRERDAAANDGLSLGAACWRKHAKALEVENINLREENARLLAKVEEQSRELGPLREFWRCFDVREQGLSDFLSIMGGTYVVSVCGVKDKWLAAKPKGEA